MSWVRSGHESIVHLYNFQSSPNCIPITAHLILFPSTLPQDEDEEDEHYSEDNLSYVYSDYDDSLHGYDSYDDPYDSDMFPF